MNNPIQNLSKKEWGLWLGSVLVVAISNVITNTTDTGDAKYCIQYYFDHYKFSGGFAYYAAVILLCVGICFQ